MVFGSLFDEAVKRKAADVSSQSKQSESTKKKKRKRNGSKRKALEADDHAAGVTEGQEETGRPQSQPSNKRSRFVPRVPPSKDALELSARLKEFSLQKRLDDALKLYRLKANDGIRDSHHACSVIDCAARCGAISEGEIIFEEMKKARMPITIETYTALLKGYAHAGMMHEGAALFQEVCSRGIANTRCLNTFLRGCLWTAAAFQKGKVVGGIFSSEIAWKAAGVNNHDVSSFDYYITQLCQAFRLDDAQKEVNRLMQVMKLQVTRGKKGDSYQADDPSALESLSICLLACARAQAMIGLDSARHAAQSTINAVDAAKQVGGHEGKDTSTATVRGGKRSWKQDVGEQRSVSNALYRGHRLAEVRNEATTILSFLNKRKQNSKEAAKRLCSMLITRLFYLSGGGSTGVTTVRPTSQRIKGNLNTLLRELMITKWISFGLQPSFLACNPQENSKSFSTDVLTIQQCEEILMKLDLKNVKMVDLDGFIPFSGLMAPSDKDTVLRPLDLELGSGSGDWAVHQARSKPERDFIAVELRADRVAQTFSRIILSEKPLTNLCCVGAECGSFLKTRVRKASISTIFVNHPEPPTQTFGADDAALMRISEGGDEPGHMLNSDILIAAVECLQSQEGQLIIVTDNRMYARLICASLVKAMKAYPSLIEPLSIDGMRLIESIGPVNMFEGQLGESIRHAPLTGSSGQSYFDRLWQTGAGSHAEKRKRFIVVVRRLNVPSSNTSRPKGRN